MNKADYAKILSNNKIINNPKFDNMSFKPRKPQYGYARDRYGRVQERDRFTDGAYHVDDYGQSSFDPEDDNGD